MNLRLIATILAASTITLPAYCMNDDRLDTIHLDYNPNPSARGQVEVVDTTLPVGFQVDSVYLLHKDGEPPSYNPLHCVDRFVWINLGRRTSFSYSATSTMDGALSSFFMAAIDTRGRIALSQMGRVQVGNPRTILAYRKTLRELPTEGVAWESLLEKASLSTEDPDLSNRERSENISVLAKAMVFARTDQLQFREDVIRACSEVMGTEGESVLTLARKLAAFVLAADLVELPDELDIEFRAWLRNLLHRPMADGRSLVSTHEDRPNNFGTHAGASRIAVAAYLDDHEEIERAANVFRGWLGETEYYNEFRFGEDLSWQEDSAHPKGINSVDATNSGFDIDGVLPDDQRRGGGFDWPPPRENYVWEALQGAMLQAILLHRYGYDTWNWGDRALSRAARWLHEVADYPAEGDDTWQSHVINYFYGTEYPAQWPSRPGKNVGFTDWLFGSLNQ